MADAARRLARLEVGEEHIGGRMPMLYDSPNYNHYSIYCVYCIHSYVTVM